MCVVLSSIFTLYIILGPHFSNLCKYRFGISVKRLFHNVLLLILVPVELFMRANHGDPYLYICCIYETAYLTFLYVINIEFPQTKLRV